MASIDHITPNRFRGRNRTDHAVRVPIWTPDTLEVVQGRSHIEEIERFRYSIYVAEQDKPLPAADHLAKRLPDADDAAALHFCVRNSSGTLVGYARMHYADGLPTATVTRLGLGDLLGRAPGSVGFISKLMVDKTLRGKTNAVRLIMSMIQYGCERFQDAEGAVFHCSSELVPLYTRMGFRPFGRPFIDPHVGQQTPMVAIFRDLEHFLACGSPIAAILGDLPAHDERYASFRDYFLVKRAFQPSAHPQPVQSPGFRLAMPLPAPRTDLASRVKLA